MLVDTMGRFVESSLLVVCSKICWCFGSWAQRNKMWMIACYEIRRRKSKRKTRNKVEATNLSAARANTPMCEEILIRAQRYSCTDKRKAHVDTHTHTDTLVHTHMGVYELVHTHKHTLIHRDTHTHMYIHTCIYVHPHTHTHARVYYTQTHILHTHTHTHAYIFTQICVVQQ